ncbi:MAG: hypothetical protein M0026_21765 [Nocardiopsaceae bacterium]|nr:hypothetical protein [Nocardiopsaceae bacterium]
MSSPTRIPRELRTGPFRGSAAVRSGLISNRQLNGRSWRRLCRDVYVFAEIPDSLQLRVAAVALLLPRGAVVSGTTAAWLHGADIRRRDDPIEVTLPRATPMRPPTGARVRRAQILAEDIEVIDGLPVTTPMRTGFDLARRVRPHRNATLVEAVVAVDALTHLGLFTPDRLCEYALRPRFHGWRGVRQAAVVAEHAEPLSESPGETRLRLRIVLAGFPRPQAQVNLFDPHGRHVARLDLAYPERRIAIEYDGEVHSGRWREDAARRNRILALGWKLYSYTARDLRPGVHTITSHLRDALGPPLR